MEGDEFEAAQRAREWFHTLTVPPGMWMVIRVDGRSFSRFTADRFDKPFDLKFSELMVDSAKTLLTELGARYAYTESDEVSVLLPEATDVFGRSVEKLVSISAGLASAAFTHACGEAVCFDSRVWIGAGTADVADYFSWRQADAARCALNGWCYWTLRNAGKTAAEATRALRRTKTADKNELLLRHGINFNDVPAWQRRGVGLWHEEYERAGYDPIREVEVTATRRRVHIERNLPMKDAYRELILGRVA
jgi:tRNA(His) 5'-end guanylyltransferase